MIRFNLGRALSRERLESFFMGPIYPIVVAALVICGYLFAVEYYLHFINMALITLALCVCRSIRPAIIVLCSFVFQISREHTPAINNITGSPSDYYFTEGRGVWLAVSFVAVFAALIYFLVRNKLLQLGTLRSLPLLLPSAVLALAFVLGGAFGPTFDLGSLGYSLVQVVVWFVIFYILLLGFRHERGEELVDYLVYIASVLTVILVVELISIYLAGDSLIDVDGSFIRGAIIYGWGVTNTAAQSLTVLIPVLFIGTLRGRYPGYYFAMATIAFLGAVLNLSRTALVVGAGVYIASLVITILRAENKRRYATWVATSAAVFLTLILISHDYTFPALNNYIIRGIENNGRFEIWYNSILAFLDYPLFGMGFFGLSERLQGFSCADFIPFMAHNTLVHMPACFGLFGTAAYAYYRYKTALPFFRRPNVYKTLLGIALLSVLAGSLLENFVFYILPMFSYSTIFAVAYKLISEEPAEGDSDALAP